MGDKEYTESLATFVEQVLFHIRRAPENFVQEKLNLIAKRIRTNAQTIAAKDAEIERMRGYIDAAKDALRSYQHGNSNPDLAERIADKLDAIPANKGDGENSLLNMALDGKPKH